MSFGAILTSHPPLIDYSISAFGKHDARQVRARQAQLGSRGFKLGQPVLPLTNRHENDKYVRLSPEEYLAEAYARACRVAVLAERAKTKG